MKFTPAQLEAVDVSKRDLDTCVIAGPGSGKTAVLVEYLHRLVGEGVDPLRILAITFTEKAAANMRERLARDGESSFPEQAWVSTVHGFCARLLRENAVFAGVDPEFTQHDANDSRRMQQEAITAAIEELFDQHPAALRALIRGLSSFEFEDAVLAAYDAMRGAGIRVADLAAFPTPAGVGLADIAAARQALAAESFGSWNDEALKGAGRIVSARTPREALAAIEDFSSGSGKRSPAKTRLKQLIEDARYSLITDHYAHERGTLLDIFARFDRIYRERKRQAGALDFTDLEEFTVSLLEQHAETRDRLRRQFDYVLMDEFQDTNGQQARLLALVRRPGRFYAVGDINQSIYGFRHAEPDELRDYRQDVQERQGRLAELVENFRSRPEILRAVEQITRNTCGIESRGLVPGREFQTERPVCVELIAALGDETLEAQLVARRIAELRPEFESYRDFAVLVRNTEVFGAFGGAFASAGIPYVVSGGKGFYETREVIDLTHLLRVIANPRDEISMAVVLRSPLVGLSDEELLAYFRAEGRCEPFEACLRRWRTRRDFVTFDRLLLEAIDDSGYPWTPNVDKFLGRARDAAGRMSLDAFIEELEQTRASNPPEPDAPPEDSLNAVRMMTVHAAKGLEFPVVFVSALQKGIDTTIPAVAFSRRFGLGARWRNPAGGKEKDKDDLFQHAIRKERKQREAEEANRLLYVAMTRAEQHLVLSFSKKPAHWAKAVVEKLGVDVTEPRDEIVPHPGWHLRLFVTDYSAPLTRVDATAPVAEERYVAIPAPTPQHNTDATVSNLALFSVCPRKYYLANYLGFTARRSQDPSPQPLAPIPAAELGIQVHAILAGSPPPAPDPEAERLAAVFRQSPLSRRAGRARRVEREFAFLMAVEDLVVRGQIDLWFEEGGELIVVDYKTDAVNGIEAHQRARDYELQLRLYALAIERVAGRPPDRAYLHFLRPNTLVEVDITPSLLESPEQMVRDFLDAQSRMEWPLHETPACVRCEFYRDLCPAGIAHAAVPPPDGSATLDAPARAMPRA